MGGGSGSSRLYRPDSNHTRYLGLTFFWQYNSSLYMYVSPFFVDIIWSLVLIEVTSSSVSCIETMKILCGPLNVRCTTC